MFTQVAHSEATGGVVVQTHFGFQSLFIQTDTPTNKQAVRKIPTKEPHTMKSETKDDVHWEKVDLFQIIKKKLYLRIFSLQIWQLKVLTH